jgi:hypothetical protein
MTRGSRNLSGNASFYDLVPILFLDRFRWSERASVLDAIREIFSVGGTRWTFGGAYLFWAQTTDGDGELLYCGEARDLCRRQVQHFSGLGGRGNRFKDLTAYFAAHPRHKCGVGLFAIPPNSLEWLSPPDGLPFADSKRAGEALEGLLLRAAESVFGCLPVFNARNDSSPFRHDSDGVRFQSLIRYLLDSPDATMDFTTFSIRAERAQAAAALRAKIAECRELV